MSLAVFCIINVFCFQTNYERPQEADFKNYEEIKPDAAWCGPRALFFIFRIHQIQTSLETVVRQVNPDTQGYCTLESLAHVAQDRDIPTSPIKSGIDTIIAINKPAILCCRKAFINTQATGKNELVDRRVHFIAFIKAEGDNCWILDTSKDMSARLISKERLNAAFLNQSLVFGLTLIEELHYVWLPFILWTLALLVLLALSTIVFVKRRTRT